MAAAALSFAGGFYKTALLPLIAALSYVGAYARNARHEGGRTLVDVVVNEAQASSMLIRKTER